MIDVKEIHVLNTKKCNCGYEFTLKDFTKLENLTDTHGFYANIVKHYTMAKCPVCHKETILLLKQKGQTWEVMNTAKFTNESDTVTTTEQATIDLKEQTDLKQEFICPVCKKVCKNKAGLNTHMKVHSN
jgi:uncharacterized protein YbaR (Trm112 family)